MPRHATSQCDTTLHGLGLTKTINEHVIWHDLDVEFNSGSITAITGRSGSGKTTLLNTLGLLEPLTNGTIIYGNTTISRLSPREIRKFYRTTVGFLFQNYALVEQWTVEQNLLLALRSIRVPRLQWRGLIDDALPLVGMEGRQRAHIYELSGGEQQRVAVARLLIHQPKIILADEPTAALDDDNANMVMMQLRHFAEHGTIVIFTTHDDTLAQQADQRYRL